MAYVVGRVSAGDFIFRASANIVSSNIKSESTVQPASAHPIYQDQIPFTLDMPVLACQLGIFEGTGQILPVPRAGYRRYVWLFMIFHVFESVSSAGSSARGPRAARVLRLQDYKLPTRQGKIIFCILFSTPMPVQVWLAGLQCLSCEVDCHSFEDPG